MSLYARLAPTGPSGFGYASTSEDVTADLDLRDRTILVTGCNSGIGFETMRVLALRGATVLGAARTLEKAHEAVGRAEGQCVALACELSEPPSVRDCVSQVEQLGRPLDAIICNAGIMALPELRQKFGYELQFFTNHVGHFILVTGLLDQLAENGRIVMVSSNAHRHSPREGIAFDDLSGEKSYGPWKAYGQSKLANILFAKELARRFEGTPRTANAVHPGVIQTNLVRHMPALTKLGFALGNPLFFKTIPQGAATQTYVAVHPDAAAISGEYWSDCNVARPRRRAEDPALARRLWDVTEQIVRELEDTTGS